VIVYGRNPVREVLRGRRAHDAGPVWATEPAAREPWLAGHKLRVTSAAEIEARCASPSHQGMCVDAGPYPYVGEVELLARPDALLLALDQVHDPQNLGALCRTAECAGAAGVVIPERRAAEVTPAVCKASAGAVEHLRIARVRNLADFLGLAKQRGCWCYGASADSTVAYDRPDYRGGVVLVMGGEGRGLRPRVAGACDQLVALPLHGHIDSLNVSAAAAVLLYEILQSRSRLDSVP
jgi:23S rRNA (guanosine2251-2'-O)-methyltransferase